MRGRSWAACVAGAGLMLGGAGEGRGQGLYAPAPAPEPERQARRMAEAMHHLADDIAAHMGRTPAGQYLARDAQELERATSEWYASLRGGVDPYQVRRSYSGIDSAWHRLRGQLGAPGVADPAIAEEIVRVDQADAQIHQTLHLNGYPPNFDAAPAPPSGLDETRRLAYALAQRGEALAATVQADYGPNPNAAATINEAAELARMVDTYYDGMNGQGASPDDARRNFAPIVQKANGVGVSLGALGLPPRVKATWDAYTSVHNLIRHNLQLTANTPDGLPQQQQRVDPAYNGGGIPYAAPQPAPVVQWAEQLDRQIEDLVANFAPTVPVVPEGREMFDEIQRLRLDARTFRGAAIQGVEPGRLAYDFRGVDADWQRLARHFARVGRGRTGPNIQRVQEIGQTCEQIHRVLGMPGYPPTFEGYQVEVR